MQEVEFLILTDNFFYLIGRIIILELRPLLATLLATLNQVHLYLNLNLRGGIMRVMKIDFVSNFF